MSRDWKVVELIDTTRQFFEKKGIGRSARLDAELLLAKVLDCRRIDLYVRFDEVVPEPTLTQFRELVRQRGERRPVKHILGRCEFYSHEFEITPDVLVPRPETERVVGVALDVLGEGPQVVADVGTGSGNIAACIARARPDVTVYATDISAAALAVARRNVAALGVDDRVVLVEGDGLGALGERGLDGALDAVVSNPPYIAEHERGQLMPEVVRYEPPEALFSGEDGMEHTLRLLADAPAFLRGGGSLVVETSPTTAGPARAAAEASGAFENVRAERDLRGIERVFVAEKKREQEQE